MGVGGICGLRSASARRNRSTKTSAGRRPHHIRRGRVPHSSRRGMAIVAAAPGGRVSSAVWPHKSHGHTSQQHRKNSPFLCVNCSDMNFEFLWGAGVDLCLWTFDAASAGTSSGTWTRSSCSTSSQVTLRPYYSIWAEIYGRHPTSKKTKILPLR
jgi:hypothetical protein